MPKDRKFNSSTKNSTKANKDKFAKENSNLTGDKKLSNTTGTKLKKKCKVCFKSNHTTESCFVLKRVRNYIKDNHSNNSLNFLETFQQDPYFELIMPLREDLVQEINWPLYNIDEDMMEEVITNVLQMEEAYDLQNDEDSH